MNKELCVTQETLEFVHGMIHNSSIKLIKMAGIRASEIAERHITLEMPLGDVNINHVGTAYAISMIMLMELAGTALLMCTYGTKVFTPIVKRMEIQYLKPSSNTLVCDLSITEEEASRLIKPILERGRGNCPLSINLRDTTGEHIAQADIVFYLIPTDMDF